MVPLSLPLAIGGWLAAPDPTHFVLADVLHVFGCFVVTAAGNVPLDKRLCATDASSLGGYDRWQTVYAPAGSN